MPRHETQRWSEYLGPGAATSLLLALLTAVAGLGIPIVWRVRQVLLTARKDQREAADVVLVLGRHLQKDRISEVFRGRLDHGLELMRAGLAPRLVVAGGLTGKSRRTEAAAGREYLLSCGAAPEEVLAEDRSRHTLENLFNVRETLRREQWSSILLVSDALHLARAAALARGLGLTVRLSPAPGAPPRRGSVAWWRRALREALLLHWYHVGMTYSRAIGSHRLLARVT
jgi:uncharacterized SAM-binding protein YcdF (DUF218 family)